MNMNQLRSTVQTHQKALSQQMRRLKIYLRRQIRQLPDNPNIERINKNCYILKSSELLKKHIFSIPQKNKAPRKIKNTRWDVWFHDFKKQYSFIAQYIEATQVEQLESRMTNLIKTGRIENKRFHPDVIANVKKVWT